ncbi:MAG: hypothetical protein ACOYVF_12200 [Candidatus Zixiibacteriota bacterium]
MKKLLMFSFFILLFACQTNEKTNQGSDKMTETDIIIATYAEAEDQLQHIVFLVESIREFGGCIAGVPVWVYVPKELLAQNPAGLERLRRTGVEVKTSFMPENARWLFYAGKVFASGEAEAEAERRGAVLVWLDDDTIFLNEPSQFALPVNIGFAYRPVMHNRSGTLYGQPVNPFWGRIYEILQLDPENQFAMVTPADKQKIRAYFNAGLLVVRPEHKILRRWSECFRMLYQDSALAEMCRQNSEHRIFLHQTALVGAVMPVLRPDQMLELSDAYNYPMFFKRMYGAREEFDSIENIVTLRYDTYFRNPEPDWSEQLKGDPDKIAWLKERLGKS